MSDRLVNTDKLGTPPQGKILVEIDYDYYERTSQGGIVLPNAAHEEAECDSDGYTLSEWIIRHGKIVDIGETDTPDYDWNFNGELAVGDVVYWSIVRFFDYPLIKCEKKYYLLMDLHEIILKVVDGKPVPVNGFYLFSNTPIKDGWGAYEIERYNPWYKLEKMGEEVIYDHYEFNYTDLWEAGMDCLLLVPPFKLEADTNRHLENDYFLAQKRHILMACWPNLKP